MEPLISVIIVTYNASGFLQNAIDSVVNQTYKKIELIIIDGNSTDNTVDIIKKNQSIINYWISEPDNGIYDAMNKGVNHCSGDYIMFLGADDLLRNTLHLLVNQMTVPDVVYYGDVCFQKSKKKYDGLFDEYKITVKNICHQAILYPKRIFDKYSYNLKYKIRADHYLNLQCFSDEKIQFKYVDLIVTDYFELGFSSSSIDYDFNNDRLEFIRNHFNKSVYYYCIFRRFISKYILFRGYYK